MKKIVLSLISFVVFFLGCGSSVESKKSSSLQAPIEIGIEMPKVITIGDDEYREHLSGQEKTSLDRSQEQNEYRDIKPITWMIENLFDEAKFNITIVNGIMNQIEEVCKDTPMNSVCKIPEKTIQFSFDKNMVDELIKFVNRDKISAIDREGLIGEHLYLGSVEFMLQDKNSSYSNSLMMDNSDIESRFFFTTESTKYIRTIKWSQDNRKVFYSSLEDGDRATLYYQNLPNSGESANLTFSSHSEEPFSLKRYIFDLSRESNSSDFFLKRYTMDIDNIKEDNQNSYGTIQIEQKHSYLQISEERGYLYTALVGMIPEVTLTEENIIDSNYLNSVSESYQQIFNESGTVETIRYCPEFDGSDWTARRSTECDYKNASTWLTESGDKSIFEPFEKLHFRELWLEKEYPLMIGGGLYYLLPSEHNITDLTIEQVLENHIGWFITMYDYRAGAYGFIYDKGYADSDSEIVWDKIKELQIVRAKYVNDLNLSLEKRIDEFELIKEEYRPVIY